MARLRFSLFTKIMLWFFLNLLLLGAIFWLIFSFTFRPEGNSTVFATTNRIETVARLIGTETNDKTREERDAVLKNYTDAYKAEFFLFDNQGRQLGGREIALPAEVLREIKTELNPPPQRAGSERREGNPPPMPPGMQPGGNPPFGGPNGGPPQRPGLPAPIFVRTDNPTLYWFGLRTMTLERGAEEPVRTRILAVSDSFYGHGLFFDPTPFIIVTLVIVGVSLLFWFPFVRNLTGHLGQMTSAAARIADEDFDVTVSETRHDELGRLGHSINHLARRLAGFTHGQKRFLGDISHELNSPLARMQFALSILEDRVDDKNRAYVEDVKEEVELMSRLVAELLAFSKAGMKQAAVKLESLPLLPLVERVVEREGKGASNISVRIAAALTVCAHAELLSRALDNVLRNALRYGGNSPVVIAAAQNGDSKVKISITDGGTGVPESEIEKLFDPFHRVETDRSRQTGGSGLGLAIVKTCVEACGGKVSAQNLRPQGFEVNIILKNGDRAAD